MNQPDLKTLKPMSTNPSLAQYMDANGWIPLSAKTPTKDDADEQGRVLCVSHTGLRDTVLLEYVKERYWTHWKPAGPGPVVETEEERMKRDDEEAREKAWHRRYSSPNVIIAEVSNFNAGWEAALAHARKARK